MPHSNMNPGARRRHNIRIVTIGRYRMLKDNVTNKVSGVADIIVCAISKIFLFFSMTNFVGSQD